MKQNLVLGIVLTLGVIIGATATRLLDAQPVPVKSTDLRMSLAWTGSRS